MGRSLSCPYSFCKLSVDENKDKTYYHALINEVSDNYATMRYWYLIDEKSSKQAKRSNSFWSNIQDSFLKNFKY